MRRHPFCGAAGHGPSILTVRVCDSEGIMKFIEPEQYRSYEGSDISGQEAIIKMLKTKNPDGECIRFFGYSSLWAFIWRRVAESSILRRRTLCGVTSTNSSSAINSMA